MRAILDKSGEGFQLTQAGYDRYIDRKAKCNINVTEKDINAMIMDPTFRVDEDLIEMVEKYRYGVIMHEWEIKEINLPEGISIDDPRLVIDEYEPYGFIEMMYYRVAIAGEDEDL